MELSAEQIEKNWNKYLKIVDTFITGERKTKLISLLLKTRFLGLLPTKYLSAQNSSFEEN